MQIQQLRRLVMSAEDVPTIEDRGGEIHVLISPTSVASNHLIMGTATVPVGGRVLRHAHPHGEECFYVLRGKGEITIEGMGVYPFQPGEAVLTPQGAVHTIQNTGEEEILVVFAASPLAPSPKDGHILHE
ncbi:cupin domain-containing protein [Leptolyngbya sp. AN03gr2]|uniref:cupin domain-containing protein n=1 Tax=unclassified Leptolyngbya TaxID=2650499 RepID=UPI003D32436B